MHPDLRESKHGKVGCVAQLDRASDYGSEGLGFESLRDHCKKIKPLHHAVAFLFYLNPFQTQTSLICYNIMNKTRCIAFSILALLSINLHAQQKKADRNQAVDALNSITTYLNQSFYINLAAYTDIRFFSSSYRYNLAKPGSFSWQIYDNKKARVRYDFGVDFNDYPEIKPDAQGYISSWDNDWLKMLKTRREMENLLAPLRLPPDGELMQQLTLFSQNLDSMLKRHYRMVQYVYDRAFEQDAPQYHKAHALITELQPCFDNYRNTARNLYQVMEELYYRQYAPLPSQSVAQQAEAEIRKSMLLAADWEHDLYQGNSAHNASYDARLRNLNAEGLAKDSLFFSQTYGYRSPANGAMPHTRYLSFYSMMRPAIYHYAGSKTTYEKHLQKAPQDYNRFTFGYNSLVEYYNRFADCADGRLLSQDMDYSMPMAARLGVDTARNPILHRYKTGMLFALEEEPPAEPLPPDPDMHLHSTMIQAAAPHHTIYLLDVSASMAGGGQLDSVKNAIAYLVKLQRSEDRISLLAFSSDTRSYIRFVSCSSKTDILQQLNTLGPGGGTNVRKGLDAAYALADSCRHYPGQTRILLATDGIFKLNSTSEKSIRHYAAAGIYLSILLSGTQHNASALSYFEKLSSSGGGNFYRTGTQGLKDILVKEASR